MIDLVTYNERLVHSVSDAIFYENISADGILYGMGYESSGNKVTISSGYGIIKGRVFEITGQEEVNIPQVTSGSVNGQIIIQIDLSNSDNPIQLIADNTMRELTQNPQFNYLAGVWEVQLATYSVTPIGVVNIDRVFNKLKGDEYVLSQLQSLTEIVTNQGTRINNQANRLTVLETNTIVEENEITSNMSNVTMRGYHKGYKVNGFFIANVSFNISSQISSYPSSTILKGLGRPGYEVNLIIHSRDNVVSKGYPCYINAEGNLYNRIAIPTGSYVINVCYKML